MVDKGDEQIRRALETGAFDNLPGKGKPLRLDDNPFEDPEWRLAHHILQTSGFSLPWIEAGKEIDAGLRAARAALGQSWSRRKAALAQGEKFELAAAEWDRAVKIFGDEIAEVNKKIFNYNLEVPSAHFQRRTVQLDKELTAITGAD